MTTTRAGRCPPATTSSYPGCVCACTILVPAPNAHALACCGAPVWAVVGCLHHGLECCVYPPCALCGSTCRSMYLGGPQWRQRWRCHRRQGHVPRRRPCRGCALHLRSDHPSPGALHLVHQCLAQHCPPRPSRHLQLHVANIWAPDMRPRHPLLPSVASLAHITMCSVHQG